LFVAGSSWTLTNTDAEKCADTAGSLASGLNGYAVDEMMSRHCEDGNGGSFEDCAPVRLAWLPTMLATVCVLLNSNIINDQPTLVQMCLGSFRSQITAQALMQIQITRFGNAPQVPLNTHSHMQTCCPAAAHQPQDHPRKTFQK